MKFKNIFYLFVLLTIFASCEDVIDVELEDGDNQLVVDAWIDNIPDKNQEIILSRTQAYFQSSFPAAETGATVTITEDNGRVYEFVDPDDDGKYIWETTAGESFGRLNGIYTLEITTEAGKRYTAVSTMRRVSPIDSIRLEDREEELGEPAGIYAEFFSRDMPGEGDAYWIKSFKNGEFLNKPEEMNLAWDGAFTPGSGVDGVIFIAPIREFINRVPDEGEEDIAPWEIGDSINLEIHSLNPEAFNFLEQSLTQMTLGDAGIFAEPPANVPTNINSLDVSEPSDNAIGFFNVAAVSTSGRRIEL